MSFSNGVNRLGVAEAETFGDLVCTNEKLWRYTGHALHCSSGVLKGCVHS